LFRCVPEFVLGGALRHKQDNIKCEYQGNAQKTLEGEVAKGARKTSTKKYEKKGTKIENETKKNKQAYAANSLKQGPSRKAASFLASREFPRILLKPKIHYRVHNSPPVVPVDSQMNPIHSLPSCFIKTHFNIIVLSKRSFFPASTQRLTKQSLTNSSSLV
jgi:hypothetical protein